MMMMMMLNRHTYARDPFESNGIFNNETGKKAYSDSFKSHLCSIQNSINEMIRSWFPLSLSLILDIRTRALEL